MIQDIAVTGSTRLLWGAAFDVDAGKYCPPLHQDFANARSIFARIVNAPGHGDMAAVSDEELSRLFRRLRPADESDGVTP